MTLTQEFLKQISKVFSNSVTLSDTFLSLQLKDKVLTEAIVLTQVFEKQVNKLFSESITITQTFLKQFSKVFSQSISLTDSITNNVSLLLEFIENIYLVDTIRKYLNNALVDIWTKTAKISSIWTKSAKLNTLWRKKPKNG